jgi:hypothetical protein
MIFNKIFTPKFFPSYGPGWSKDRWKNNFITTAFHLIKLLYLIQMRYFLYGWSLNTKFGIKLPLDKPLLRGLGLNCYYINPYAMI